MTATSNRTKKSGMFALLVVLGIMIYAPCALALPGGLGTIESKADDIKILVQAVAAILVVIGAVWCGLKFIKGDPDAWGYVWKFGLGAIIVYAAPEIVIWLST